MQTNNLRNLRVNGQLVVQITDTGEPNPADFPYEYPDFGTNLETAKSTRFTASFLGWKTSGYACGFGSTLKRCLDELSRQSETTVEEIFSNCTVELNGEKITLSDVN